MDSVQHRKLIAPPTLADVVSNLCQDKDELGAFEFIVLKHWLEADGNGEWVERIYLSDLDSFMVQVFDLDLRGWEFIGFSRQTYPTYPDIQRILAGSIYIEFSRGY